MSRFRERINKQERKCKNGRAEQTISKKDVIKNDIEQQKKNYKLQSAERTGTRIMVNEDMLKDEASKVAKELYDEEEYEEEYANTLECYVSDFLGMEKCNTYGELSEWFIDYICDCKGLCDRDELISVCEGTNEMSREEWVEDNCFGGISEFIEDVFTEGIVDKPLSKDVKRSMQENFANEEYMYGDELFNLTSKAFDNLESTERATTFTKSDVQTDRIINKGKGETK